MWVQCHTCTVRPAFDDGVAAPEPRMCHQYHPQLNPLMDIYLVVSNFADSR